MKRAVITLAVLLAAAPAVYAQRAKKPKVLPGQGIDWKGDFDEANI